MKKWWSYLVIPLAVTMIIAGIATSTWAGEKGKFRGRAVLYNTKLEVVKVPGTEENFMYSGELDGFIFNETGGTFLDKARYQVVFRGDVIKGTGKTEGYKTFTMPDGAQIFVKYMGEGSNNRESGTFTLIGGSGKYQGVKGKGTYDWTGIKDTKVSWDILEGEYELP